MKPTSLIRLTGTAWIGEDSPGYLYTDFPLDYPEHVMQAITEGLMASVMHAYPGCTVEVEVEEIPVQA